MDCLTRDDPGHDLVSEYLQAQWQHILGVEVNWQQAEWARFPVRMSEEVPHLWIVGWYADYPDPDDFLRIQWWLSPDWQNQSYDQLVESAPRMMDQEERMRMYRKADKLLVEEAPILPLCYARFHMLVKPWVKRLRPSPLRWWSWKDVVLEPH